MMAVLLLASAALLDAGDAKPLAVVPIHLPAGAAPVETLAARELAAYLARLHPETSFPVRAGGGLHPGGIHLGTLHSYPEVAARIDRSRLATAESFVVSTTTLDGAETAIIAGADPAGTLHGVYALLERLGCGFYLTDETVPPASGRGFSFAEWQLADAPLVARRIVFNWHNFLSGCTAWDLPQWQQWIVQSQKMRYNTILVHAYGNSPLAGFSFRGVAKEVGYLATTARGRDWGTAHVNDVRRLHGGTVFAQPVFGAAAAQVPAEDRANAAQALMQSVFRFAAARGMGVWFALDIDTTMAQPQEIIERLPLPGRFQIRVARTNAVQGAVAGELWLANPDTADGYLYYRAQAAALLERYPEIGGLALWIRVRGSPWLELSADQLPPAWQDEFAAEIARTPAAARLGEAPGRFALGKVVRAYQRALRELGRTDVQLAVGSWRCEWLEPSHRFCPPGVAFLPLDYDVGAGKSEFATAERRARTRRVAQERPVIPIAWAQHDDRHYVGRSYTPWSDFSDKLADMGAAGFGVIHWMTRPLDLYFKSLGQQAWQGTRNAPLEASCRRMADHLFAGEANELLREYLHKWIMQAPQFGSASTSRFIVEPVTGAAAAAVAAGCRERLSLLERAGRLPMTERSRERLAFFGGMERFAALCFESEAALQLSVEQFRQADYAAARESLARSRVEEAIDLYAEAASHGGITRGEQGVLIGLNLGWLPFHENQRQALGLAAARYDFGPTQSEKLAQAAGTMSYTVDAQRRLWRKVDAAAGGARTFEFAARDEFAVETRGTPWAEICRDGVIIEQPFTLELGPLLFDVTSVLASVPPVTRVFRPGEYQVRLLLVHSPAEDGNAAAFDFEVYAADVGAASASEPVRLGVTTHDGPAASAGPTGPGVHEVTRIVRLDAAGRLQIVIRPLAGSVRLGGLEIEPVAR